VVAGALSTLKKRSGGSRRTERRRLLDTFAYGEEDGVGNDDCDDIEQHLGFDRDNDVDLVETVPKLVSSAS
jgi:hypothetical protein